MRIHVDMASHMLGTPKILQVEKTPPLGDLVPINGKYVIPVIEGSTVQVTPTTYVLPVDGQDIYSQMYAELLAQYPMFRHIYFNPLLTAANASEFDPTGGSFTAPIRAQIGSAPTRTAILPLNASASPAEGGFLLTNVIDLTTATAGAGADEFMVYWKIYEFDVSDDVFADSGALTGQNTPTIRSIKEVNQEPPGLTVRISNNDGLHWVTADRLRHATFYHKDYRLRVGFFNTGTEKIYLATYAVMF